MKKLSKANFLKIKNWIYRNARPIDLALWQYHFEKGNKENVLFILQYYQNEDGGFGKAIDADNWNPNSTPYNTQIAIKILRQIDFTDVKHPIYQGIFRYLESTKHKSEHGWSFTIPSNDNHPHGVWWSYNAETNIYQNVGTTASLCGFILRYGQKNSPLYELAKKYTGMLMDRLKKETVHGDMGVGGYCELLEDIEKAELMNEFDYCYLAERVHFLVTEKIQNEKTNFMANPLEFILSPQSKYYSDNEQEVNSALDAIIESIPENDVWPIPWEWYNEYTSSKYFAISENWWKAAKAMEKLMQLRSFARLEF